MLSEADTTTVLEAYGVPVSRTEFDLTTESDQTTAPGFELYVGAKLDAQFGPVVKFGMGGAMFQIHQDITLTLPPLSSAQSRGPRVLWKLF